MKRSAVRLLAFLSALVMLMGLFAVQAEDYAEYSGGVSVWDARAATGFDTDVYVCVDGVWRDIGDMQSHEETVNLFGIQTVDFDVVDVADLPDALSDFGFNGYSAGDSCFPVTIEGSSTASVENQYGWPEDGMIPVRHGQYESGESFGVYYAPLFEVADWDVGPFTATVSSLSQTNSFYTINIEGLTDAELATVDYGSAHDTDFGHVVLVGDTVTVTVPKDGYTWSYDGSYGAVIINEQDSTITYTFENVKGKLTLTALSDVVDVTVQQVDFDGNVIASQTYSIEKGGALPNEALAGYASDCLWYDEQGNGISPSTMTFTSDAVITTKPKVASGNVGANFYVYLDGRWQKLSHTTNTLYGPLATPGNRYAIRVSQLEEAFGPFGFDADTYTSSKDRRFAYNYVNSTTVWADTTSLEYYGEWVLPLSVGESVYDIYYLPNNQGPSNIENKDPDDYGQANAFYTVTLTESVSGKTEQFILEKGTVLSEWLDNMADTTLPGFTRPVGEYIWKNTDTGAALDAADTAETVQKLTGLLSFTVTLTDEDGNVLDTVDGILEGTSVALWLEENDGLVLADGTTIHDYEWTMLNGLAITTQVFDEDKTLVGKPKELFTVTFVAKNPNGTEDGGYFINDSLSYNTISVLRGDSIPETFVSRMRANLQLNEGWAFDHWTISIDTGELPWDPEVLISSDAIVWPEYTQEVYVRFWKDRSKSEQFARVGLEKQPVGSIYQGSVPDEDTIMAVAPMEDMRFRYWCDLNTGRVFTLDTDKVRGNLDLYPVFERAIFSFNDKDTGTPLAVLYDGTDLDYEPEERPGYYYAGLEVTSDDGTPVLIPNGTAITREYLEANNISLPELVNGRYNIPATPVYKQQRTVVYHTGDDAKFIIFGAENQESYTVQVNDELVLLGALDIVNVTSPIGLALDGWTTIPGGTTVQYASNASFEGDTALDSIVDAGETVHLYPVWTQQENTIAINFVSQYPDGAVDVNGNELIDSSYTIYIRDGSKPTMPTLEQAGMTTPANTYTFGTEEKKQYVLAGWSRDADGDLSGADADADYTQTWGTYIEGSEYAKTLSKTGTVNSYTFYAIWVDENPVQETHDAYFFIRADGVKPFEPSQHKVEGTSNRYYPTYGGNHKDWPGKIYTMTNITNNVAEVEANIAEEPKPETVLEMLMADEEYRKQFPEIEKATVENYDSFWFIDWYVCKYSSQKAGCDHYHVDGRIRFSTQVELNYHPNGGTNVPASKVYDKGKTVEVNLTQEPTRENFVFIGWDEDPHAKVPDYPAEGLNFPTGPNLKNILMDTDKDLYAIWEPMPATIPMNERFKGEKYEQTNDGPETAPAAGHRYQFTIRAISLPEGAEPYETITATSDADGNFSFPQITANVAGLYVFEVREVVGDLPVQYDASVYRLTVNIVESDYGLGIAGYSFTRNNRIVPVDGNNLDNMVFKFTNRTGIRDVTATKVWDDANNQDGLRPAGVNVTLYRRGDTIWSERATLTAAGNWAWTWTGLPILDSSSGAIYEYYIVEDPVPNYTTTYSGDMNAGLVVTNSYTPRTADFPVDKSWHDGDDAAGIRPETLTYILQGSTPDGTVVSTTVSDPVPDPWRYTFEDMPLYKDGQLLLYSLTEVAIPGYSTTITAMGNSQDGSDFHVTNTLEATPVTVTKQIAGNAANPDATFPFTAWVYDANGLLVTDIEAGEGYTVDSDGTIRFTLGGGDSVQLKLLPLGGTIVLAEESGSYTATYAPEGTQTTSGMRFNLTAGLTITVTNTRETTVPTGVALDTVPYLLLLGLALVQLAGLVIKRRAV